MKEQIIDLMEACPSMAAKKTPEEEIKHLKQELKDQGIKKEELWDELSQKKCQVYSLVDIVCDLREMNKDQANDLSWQRRRTSEYRECLNDIRQECHEVIYSYELDDGKDGKPSKDVYEFAKKIDDIVRRF